MKKKQKFMHFFSSLYSSYLISCGSNF